MRDIALERENLVWTLAAMCQLHRMPFDGELVVRAFPPPYSVETLLHAAAQLGFRAGAARADVESLAHRHLPCLAIMREAPAANDAATATRCVLVVRVADGEVHCVAPGNPNPQAQPVEAFAVRFTGHVVGFAPAAEAAQDHDAPRSAAPAFGFRWFAVELLKHRRIWRDVLLASAAIQLLGARDAAVHAGGHRQGGGPPAPRTRCS